MQHPPVISRQHQTLQLGKVNVELSVVGKGPRVVLFHSEEGPDVSQPFVDELARTFEVFAPVHPGFGDSDPPRSFSTVDDLAYLYLDFLEHLGSEPVIVYGSALGAWIAAEVAIKSTARISHLVLANPVGIKVSPRDVPDIVDIYMVPAEERRALAYHKAAAAQTDFREMPDEAVARTLRARDAIALYGWSPYMHDAKLRQRLYRIDVPTLVLWGASDQLAKPEYGRAFAEEIPQAQFKPVERCGHFPELERPQEIAQYLREFVASKEADQ